MFDKEIIKRLNELPKYHKDYILGEDTNIVIDVFSNSHNLNGSQKIIFENGFILFLLMFFNRKDFTEFLNVKLRLTAEDSLILQNAIFEALPKEIAESLLEYDKISTQNTNIEYLAKEISDTEKVLSSLNSPDKEKVYPSQQPDLTQIKNTTPPNNPPRWESEN